jgi:membrane-associated phospholipid phosphatase
MIASDAVNFLPIWHILTRLGEAQILLPAAALTAVALFARLETRRLALSWMMLIITAAVITTASKVAFIGWGIGWADINFTGVSGHAMFAAAIYPILMMTFVPGQLRGNHRFSLALGCALALLVGLSRIEVGAHSWSEVLAGLMVGGAVTATALAISKPSVISLRPIVPVILLAWVAVMPFELHASQTHSLVIRLALAMSGNETPFTRRDLLRQVRQQSALPAYGA